MSAASIFLALENRDPVLAFWKDHGEIPNCGQRVFLLMRGDEVHLDSVASGEILSLDLNRDIVKTFEATKEMRRLCDDEKMDARRHSKVCVPRKGVIHVGNCVDGNGTSANHAIEILYHWPALSQFADSEATISLPFGVQ